MGYCRDFCRRYWYFGHCMGSYATGGIILLAIGLCMITGLPAILQIAGIWLAAVTIMIYIYSLPDTDFVIKVMGFIPTIALAFWVSFKFWK